MTAPQADSPPHPPVGKDWYAGMRLHIEKNPKFAALRALMASGDEAPAVRGVAETIHAVARKAIAHNLSSVAEAMVIAAIDAYLRQDLKLAPIVSGADDAVATFARDLAERSHAVLPPLPPGQVAAMLAYFMDAPVRPGDNADGGAPGDLAAAREQSHFARYPTTVVMDCPHLIEIATDPIVLATAERHLGTVPTTLGFAAWWSFADRRPAEKTQCFHWDSPFDYRYCKMLIYLTDVDGDGGPHMVIERTHELAAIEATRRRVASRHPEFLSWYLEPTWKSDAETQAFFPQPVTTITGAAGTRFIANTRAMHKALSPRRHDRLICQAIYGVSPLPQVGDVKARPAAAIRGGTLPAWVSQAPFDYVNRLFIATG